ncbi:MAG TPA: hypothetical protein PKX12_15830, partial [Spirochaetota bacterium]|nr:hypothetical protein [Spirochaetota bacterium]
MSDIPQYIVFTREEEQIVQDVISVLTMKGLSEEVEAVSNNRSSLHDLANSISRYPSILESNKLINEQRTIESLITSICEREVPDMILRIPTKAILGRAYTIAKINFLLMLNYISRNIPELAQYDDTVKTLIANNVFTMTAEEVYLAIVEDLSISTHIRHNAANLIAHNWEYRLDCGVKEFAPILQNLWRARNRLIPAFGTMMGFTELFMMSNDTEPVWFDYLQRDELSDDEVFSLEEFIFGLTYEELVLLRSEMKRQRKTSLRRDEALVILGNKHSYPDYDADDSREMYRSFRDRKNHGRYRKRAGVEGPKKTFEENLMRFLLSVPE